MTKALNLTLVSCTDNLEECIHALIQTILKHTGIVMHVFMGGPDPRNNGELAFWK